jgi:hypothetical protein
MAARELVVRVHLDWSGPGHYDQARALPCRMGDGPTKMRDSSGRPCHKACAEEEIARELLGRGSALVFDERVLVTAMSGREGRR